MRQPNWKSAVTFVFLAYALCTMGCVLSGPKYNWSENIALVASSGREGSKSLESGMHDDNINTYAETSPLIPETRDQKAVEAADKFSQATLRWIKPQTIQKIVVTCDQYELEFFNILYKDKDGEWQLLKEVKNNVSKAYKYTHPEPITTTHLQIRVPNRWDSRRVGGQKRRTVGEGGAPTITYKKIREIEVYYALPMEEPAAEPTP